MAKTFEQQVASFTDGGERALLAVARDAISEVAEQANTPVSKGGRMRVDTGFLRASAVAELNQIPSGPTEGRARSAGETGAIYSPNAESLNLVLAKMKLGDTVFFGWTARYAKYRETYDAFLETALQNWQGIVNVSIRKFRR